MHLHTMAKTSVKFQNGTGRMLMHEKPCLFPIVVKKKEKDEKTNPLTSLTLPASITYTTSLIVILVSAIFVARI